MVQDSTDATKFETRGRWLVKFVVLNIVVLLPALLLSVESAALFFALSIVIPAGSLAFAFWKAGPQIDWVAKTYCSACLVFTSLVLAMTIYALDQRGRCETGELDCTCVPSEDLVHFDRFGQMQRFEGNTCAP